MSNSVEFLRNVAIVAHVDHGKTTLVDKLLRQSGSLDERGDHEKRVMVSGVITDYSSNYSDPYLPKFGNDAWMLPRCFGNQMVRMK